MPSDFMIDSARGVVFSKGWGVFTPEDYFDHLARLQSDPRFDPRFHQVVDCRAITVMALTSKQVAELADRTGFAVQSRRAFVVSTDLQYGLSRVFAAHREMGGGQDVGVFRTMEDALAWLNLPTDLDPFAHSAAKPD